MSRSPIHPTQPNWRGGRLAPRHCRHLAKGRGNSGTLDSELRPVKYRARIATGSHKTQGQSLAKALWSHPKSEHMGWTAGSNLNDICGSCQLGHHCAPRDYKVPTEYTTQIHLRNNNSDTDAKTVSRAWYPSSLRTQKEPSDTVPAAPPPGTFLRVGGDKCIIFFLFNFELPNPGSHPSKVGVGEPYMMLCWLCAGHTSCPS